MPHTPVLLWDLKVLYMWQLEKKGWVEYDAYKHLLMLNYKHQNKATAKIQLVSEQQHLPFMKKSHLPDRKKYPTRKLFSWIIPKKLGFDWLFYVFLFCFFLIDLLFYVLDNTTLASGPQKQLIIKEAHNNTLEVQLQEF